MAMLKAKDAPPGFHVRNWGFWGWLETAIKAVAIVFGLVAFFTTDSAAPLIIDGHPRVAAVGLLALLTLAMGVIIIIRLLQQEIISIIYAVGSFLGHAGLLVALLRAPLAAAAPGLVFCAFMVAGELVRQEFFRQSGYTEGPGTTGNMVLVSRGMMVSYVLLALLLVL